MATDQTTRARPAWSWRGGQIALLASLALNALFIGGLASAFFKHGAERQQQGHQNLGAYVSTLPRARSEAIMKRADERRRVLNPLRRDVRQARDDALSVLTADPFDREKFLNAETRLIQAESTLRLAQRDVIADIAGSLTPDERRAYLRWRAPQRGPAQGGQPPPPPRQ